MCCFGVVKTPYNPDTNYFQLHFLCIFFINDGSNMKVSYKLHRCWIDVEVLKKNIPNPNFIFKWYITISEFMQVIVLISEVLFEHTFTIASWEFENAIVTSQHVESLSPKSLSERVFSPLYIAHHSFSIALDVMLSGSSIWCVQILSVMARDHFCCH